MGLQALRLIRRTSTHRQSEPADSSAALRNDKQKEQTRTKSRSSAIPTPASKDRSPGTPVRRRMTSLVREKKFGEEDRFGNG